jgi:hypothetical protein
MGRFAILQIVPGREIFELNLDLGWAQLVAAAAHMRPLSELAGPTCEPTPLLTCACPRHHLPPLLYHRCCSSSRRVQEARGKHRPHATTSLLPGTKRGPSLHIPSFSPPFPHWNPMNELVSSPPHLAGISCHR